MIANGEEFSRRLETYSDDTIRLIFKIDDRELFPKALEIVATTETEEEVVEKLRLLEREMKK